MFLIITRKIVFQSIKDACLCTGVQAKMRYMAMELDNFPHS